MLRDLAARAAMTSAQAARSTWLGYRKMGLVEQDPANGHYFL